MQIPKRWNPVKLEGDFDEGFILLADMQRPRLGLRWAGSRKVGRDSLAWVNKSMRQEVGQLAAGEAADFAMPDWNASRIYIEPKPPGRDVWMGVSRVSGRGMQVIHHAHRRDRVLSEVLLPTLIDDARSDPRTWSVLDLCCRVPAHLMLTKPRLFAGDLGLTFAGKQRRQLLIRQIGPASVALKRMPLERWLKQQQASERKNYRPSKFHQPKMLVGDRGDEMAGLSSIQNRRWRFFWKMRLPPKIETLVMHDQRQDRLRIVQGGGENLDLDAIARSMG